MGNKRKNDNHLGEPSKQHVLKGLRLLVMSGGLHKLKLNRNECRAYLVLLCHANYQTGMSRVGLETIAKEIGIRKQKVTILLESLAAKGIGRARPVLKRVGGRGNSTHRWLPVDENDSLIRWLDGKGTTGGTDSGTGKGTARGTDSGTDSDNKRVPPVVRKGTTGDQKGTAGGKRSQPKL